MRTQNLPERIQSAIKLLLNVFSFMICFVVGHDARDETLEEIEALKSKIPGPGEYLHDTFYFRCQRCRFWIDAKNLKENK